MENGKTSGAFHFCVCVFDWIQTLIKNINTLTLQKYILIWSYIWTVIYIFISINK